MGKERPCVQRLFSTFAEGWPGAGLLIQRVLTSTVLLYFGIAQVAKNDRSGLSVLFVIAAVAGLFLLVGLWTPVAGTAIAVAEVWILWAWSGSSVAPIVLGGLAATVAMIGPGAWSVDAKLYGRKHLQNPRH
jgi:putative oxidoreductase